MAIAIFVMKHRAHGVGGGGLAQKWRRAGGLTIAASLSRRQW
jgi:hypothetical protein